MQSCQLTRLLPLRFLSLMCPGNFSACKKIEEMAIKLIIIQGNANDFYVKEKQMQGQIIVWDHHSKYAQLSQLKMPETCIGEAVYHLVASPERAALQFSTV